MDFLVGRHIARFENILEDLRQRIERLQATIDDISGRIQPV